MTGSRRKRATGAGRAMTLSLGVSLGIQGMNLITAVLLARALGLVGRGELTAVLLWPALLSAVGSLGVGDALTYHAARREAPSGSLIGTGTAISLIQGVMLIGLGLVIEPIVLQKYGAHAVHSAYLALGTVPLNLIALSLIGIMNGQQRMFAYQALRGFIIFANVIALVAVAVFTVLTVRSAVWAYLVASGVMLAVTTCVSRTDGSRLRVQGRLGRSLLAYGARSHTSTVSVLLNSRLDQLVVSVFLAPRLLGLYTVAVALTAVTVSIGYSMAPVVLAVVAGLKPGAQRRARVRVLTSTTFAISLAVTLPLLLLAPQLVTAVFGRAFSPAATAARILLVSSVLFSANRALESVLKAVGRPLDAGTAETLGLCVTTGALAGLVPLFGLEGAASALVLAAMTSAILLLRRTDRALKLSAREALIPQRGDLHAVASTIRSLGRTRAASDPDLPAPEDGPKRGYR